jgi:hypothetical protein
MVTLTYDRDFTDLGFDFDFGLDLGDLVLTWRFLYPSG